MAHQEPLTPIISFVLAGLLALLWFGAFNPITHFTPGIGSGVYLYIGQQMLRGAAPHRDVFDNKGPLLNSIDALGLLWIALVTAVAVLCLVKGGWSRWGTRVLIGVGGAASDAAGVLAGLAAGEALTAFCEDFSIYNAVYVGGHDLVDRLSSIRFGASRVGYLTVGVAVVA